jgi:hypothetical protein
MKKTYTKPVLARREVISAVTMGVPSDKGIL